MEKFTLDDDLQFETEKGIHIGKYIKVEKGAVYNDQGYVTVNNYPDDASAKKELTVPQELLTEEAQAVLLRFQGAGLLDETLQPVGLSRPKKAVLAHTIAGELGIKNMWSVFAKLWGENALSTAYQEGMKQDGMITFLESINTLLD